MTQTICKNNPRRLWYLRIYLWSVHMLIFLTGAFFILFCFANMLNYWVRFLYKPYVCYACMFPLYSYQLSVSIVWNCFMHNKCMSLYRNFTNYGIYLVFRVYFHWKLFSKNNKESSPAQTWHVWPKVKFAGKLLLIRRSRKQCDRCWPLIRHKKSITDKHSNESWNWFVKSSIPGTLFPILENFRRHYSWPNWPPLGLQGWIFLRNIAKIIC